MHALPPFTNAEVNAVHARFHGLLTAHFAHEETLATAWRMLALALKKK